MLPAISNEDFRLIFKARVVKILFGFGVDLIKTAKFEPSYCMSSVFASETSRFLLVAAKHLESIYGEFHMIAPTCEAKLACGFNKQKKNSREIEVSCVHSRLEITIVKFKPENFITQRR